MGNPRTPPETRVRSDGGLGDHPPHLTLPLPSSVMTELCPTVAPGQWTCVPRRGDSRANLSSGDTITDEERGDGGHPWGARCHPATFDALTIHPQVSRPTRTWAGAELSRPLWEWGSGRHPMGRSVAHGGGAQPQPPGGGSVSPEPGKTQKEVYSTKVFT